MCVKTLNPFLINLSDSKFIYFLNDINLVIGLASTSFNVNDFCLKETFLKYLICFLHAVKQRTLERLFSMRSTSDSIQPEQRRPLQCCFCRGGRTTRTWRRTAGWTWSRCRRKWWRSRWQDRYPFVLKKTGSCALNFNAKVC